MANRVEFVRDLIETQPSPKDKGVKTVLEITAYDNGGFNINGHFVRDGRVNPGLSLSRILAQIVEELEEQVAKRNEASAA